MRILLEPGSYSCLNLGDVAMMQVAVARLTALWPQAEIRIVTESPQLLAHYCPSVRPVPIGGKRAWVHSRILGRLHRGLRHTLGERVDSADTALRNRMPALATRLLALKMRVKNLEFDEVQAFLDAIQNADLVVASGSGAIADPFHERALQLMDTLAMAQHMEIPCVMFGQGIGPVENVRLWSAIKQVLPGVKQLGVRESLRSPELLSSAGVTRSRVHEAGDDALEMALDHASSELGQAIGVNLRLTGYSELNADTIPPLRKVLGEAARKYQAELLPITILRRDDADWTATRAVLSGPDVNFAPADLDTPCKVVRLTARCRLVVTSSYHAAVFALAQGIPAIGLVCSRYYGNKFEGLRQQFGEGCRIVPANEDGFTESLACNIERAWESAPVLKPALLEASYDLTLRTQQAYQRLPELLAGLPRQVA